MSSDQPSFVDRIIRFCLENQLVVGLLTLFLLLWGLRVAPFDWQLPPGVRDAVPVDAIPDLGENQQIVFTDWPGRSPQDIDDQITYPLTVALMGMPQVKTIRSYSMFGFSSIYVIFEEQADFYWSRSRILEKLNSLPSGTLPEGVQPRLGPDATGLGQVFWYTLEGRTPEGEPAGGWDLHELRSLQDWQVRYALLSVPGVSEVASIGGFVQEYQIDVDPAALRAYNVKLPEVVEAIRMANQDVGARSIEVNQVEYLVRGVGFIKSVTDIENAVIRVKDGVPVYIKNIAQISLGPAMRRGVLDKEGAEAVGGVVVVRYQENPLAVIQAVKQKIQEIARSLPSRTLPDGTVSQVTLVPFYDRTGLIHETLHTLSEALTQEVLVTILVILIMVRHLGSSLLISALLPFSVFLCFIAMKQFGVDANVVALSGIAIAIGTMVDMGIVLTENILRHHQRWREGGRVEPPLEVVYTATREVGSAVLTAIATTVVSFLPVFALEGAEGKLFKPLAYTKTFCLIAAVLVALTLLPAYAQFFFRHTGRGRHWKILAATASMAVAVAVLFWQPSWWLVSLLLVVSALLSFFSDRLPRSATLAATIAIAATVLAFAWMPLGLGRSMLSNLLFVVVLVGLFMGMIYLFQRSYVRMLRWCLHHKALFLCLPASLVLLGLFIWFGASRLARPLPGFIQHSSLTAQLNQWFPGLGREFMPTLNEGSFLYMPSTMPHASIGESLDALQKQDQAIAAIPEVSDVVGKIGRVDSALDPAPISMVETVIQYHSEYLTDDKGRVLRFQYEAGKPDLFRAPDGRPVPAPDGLPYQVPGTFARDAQGQLMPHDRGMPFRIWRPALDPALNPERAAWPGIRAAQDIWDEIVEAAAVPGSTTPPILQPIATRLIMLQTGMRAPIGVKVRAPNLEALESASLEIARVLQQVPSVNPQTITPDRIIGKPYLEIIIDRLAIARYGIKVQHVQEIIETAIGGRKLTTTIEGRERYPVRVRYLRELRNQIDELEQILVPSPDGAQIPLSHLAAIEYTRGPQMIKSEDAFLVAYVTFDKQAGIAEVEAVEDAARHLDQNRLDGTLELPPGISYSFSGSFENQVRARNRLALIVPLSLFIIFLILYLQFRSVPLSFLVFSGIFVAWSGGFIMLWLYNQPWFLNFSVAGVPLRDLFQIHPYNLSVAVWVGFLALFGIATDDGVLFATILTQTTERANIDSIYALREAVIEGAQRRIRPALMTSATTILALLPVLTSRGRGSEIMVPMAIPSFGGMLIAIVTVFVVPVLYCALRERQFNQQPTQ